MPHPLYNNQTEAYPSFQSYADGCNNFEIRTIIQSNIAIQSLNQVPIRKGIETSVNLVTKDEIKFIVNKNAKDDEFQWVASTVEDSKLVAPIVAGDKLGSLVITYKDQAKSIDLIAKHDVKKASFIRLFFRSIKIFFNDLFISIKNIF